MTRRGTTVSGRSRGVTLIEVLIAVVLIAVLTGTIVAGSGMLGASRLRAAASLIVSTVRFASTRANATGKPVRVVFDLEKNRLMLEESASNTMVRDASEGPAAGAEASTEAEREALQEAERLVQGPSKPRPRFSAVKDFGKEGRPFEGDVRFRQVQTEHDDEPVTSGRAYLYFWPGGQTEWASIQLTRSLEDEGLSVLVSPLTGRARIERGREGLPERLADSDEGEREEP